MNYTLRLIGRSPWTLLGLLLVWTTRCERRYYGDPRELVYRGSIWIWRWLRGQGLRGLTIGEVIILTDHPTGATLAHERAHVQQARRLGVWYLPAYLWGCVAGLLRAVHTHHPMEKEAREAEKW